MLTFQSIGEIGTKFRAKLIPTLPSPPAEVCDEVTCLVYPGKACCKQKQKTLAMGNGELAISAATPSLIYLDGKKRGSTPRVLEIKAGKHQLRLVPINGSKVTQRSINVKAGIRSKLKIR